MLRKNNYHLKILRFSRKILFIIFFSFILCIPHLCYATKKKTISCKAVIFSDSTKIKRLYGKNVHKKILPASTTKIMTALIAMQQLPLNKYVTVNKNATRVVPTKIFLRPGEEYKVRDLIYAILIMSANDASVVLAEAVAGSEKNFVKMMNKKAKQIGARHTKFANSHGLPTPKNTQYTTAYDMYLIFREALKYPFFRKAITYKYKNIYSKNGRKITLKSHNKILFKNWKKKIYGKTGYTKAAGACFIGTLKKGKSSLIIGAFGCPKRWKDIKYIVSTYGGIRL